MKTATRQLGLSARAYHRVLKLLQTIADLAGAEAIAPPHLAEALHYRVQKEGGRDEGNGLWIGLGRLVESTVNGSDRD